MRPGACQRWIAVSDARSAGARIDEGDADFARKHEAACRECSIESAVWRSFAAAGVDSPDESGARVGPTWPGSPAMPALVDHVLARAARAPSTPLPRHRFVASPPARVSPHVPRIAVMTLGLAAAAAAVMAFRGHRSLAPPITAGPAPAPATAPASAAPLPSLAPPGAPALEAARAPAQAAPGYRCDSPVADLTVCVAGDARARTRQASGGQRVLDLREGRVVVALGPRAPKDAMVVVITPSGRVTAAAATFSVEVDGSGATWTRVERGAVRASRARIRAATAVAAGQEMRLDIASRPKALPLVERSSDLAVLAMEVAASEPPVTPRPTPLAAERRTAAAESAPRDGQTVDADSPPDATAMLVRARSLFGRGAFAAAAQEYESAYEAAPTSPEGRAALVSLGDLRLSELGDPRGALSAFDAYLAGGGVLASEAEFGRIGALRALGRHDEERTAARAFLQVHTSGPHADALRRRLEN